jgi:hypothetical protein
MGHAVPKGLLQVVSVNRLLIALVAAALTLCPIRAVAEEPTRVTGFLEDPNGRPLARATVTIHTKQGVITRVTDRRGQFAFVVGPKQGSVGIDAKGDYRVKGNYFLYSGGVNLPNGGDITVEIRLTFLLDTSKRENWGEPISVTTALPVASFDRYDLALP